MKILEAGTPKYLLLDDERVTRNGERAKPGDPVVVVIETIGNKSVRHTGYHVLAEGPVTLAYDQRGIVVTDGRRKLRAAYMTDGRIAIATERDQVLSLPTDAPSVSTALAPDAAAGSTKPAKTKSTSKAT